MVEVELFEIRMDERRPDQVVILRETTGSRHLPIVIGHFEAQAIQIKVSNMQVPRPLTHDLLNNIIRDMGGEIDYILINKLEHNTFYARIVVNRNGDSMQIDSRPSDAIALAIRAEVPIYVEEEVLSQVTEP